MEPTILAAIISAIVSVFGVLVSITTSRWSIKLHNKDIELKAKELDATIKKINNDVDSVRQAQFSDTLKKRADGYPKLWSVIRDYTINWDDEKPKDLEWGKEFLIAINKVDAEYGVFYSQSVYEKFHELQLFLHDLKKRYKPNEIIAIEDLIKIDEIFKGNNNNPGLATYLKDDLGSYREVSIQSRLADEYVSLNKKNEESIYRSSDIFYSEKLSASRFRKHRENLKKLNSIREEWLSSAKSVILKPSDGILAVISILEDQKEFKEIASLTGKFIATNILEQPNRKIELTDSLIISGMIDHFSLTNLELFIEGSFGVQIEYQDFDTLLELTALIYKQKNK